MTVHIKIENCKECKYIQEKTLYTEDSFEHAYDWFCKHPEANNKKIKGYMERPSDEPKEIPDWCPLRRNNND